MNSPNFPCLRIDMFDQFSDLFTNVEKIGQEVNLGQNSFFLGGISCEFEGKSLFGSSLAGTQEEASAKASFELLERWGLITHSSANFPDYELSFEGDCRLSLSNGAAFHSSSKQAKESAESEFWEREVFLRSWYGGLPPQQISTDHSDPMVIGLKTQGLEVRTYSFSCFQKHFVFLTIAFKDWKNPPVYVGFGSHKDLALARRKSVQECTQRYVFLKDECFEEEIESFSPSSYYHQEYFMRKRGDELLKNWLDGINLQTVDLNFPELLDIKFDDLTPNPLKTKAYVYRAYSSKAIPLLFGRVDKLGGKKVPISLQIHPLA